MWKDNHKSGSLMDFNDSPLIWWFGSIQHQQQSILTLKHSSNQVSKAKYPVTENMGIDPCVKQLQEDAISKSRMWDFLQDK